MVWLAPSVEDALLQGRDVLVLVHHEAAVALMELLGDLGVILQHSRGVQEQVLEVQQLGLVLELLVSLVDGDDLIGGHRWLTVPAADGLRIVVRRDQRRLGPLDLTGKVTQHLDLGRRADPVRGLADQAQLALDQVPRRVPDHPRPEVAELAQGGAVERAGLRGRDPQRPQPHAHLARRAVGERDRQDLTGGDVAGVDQVGDPVGDRPGLSGTRAGEHAHRSAWGLDGRTLFRVEAVEQLLFRFGDHLFILTERPHCPSTTWPGVFVRTGRSHEFVSPYPGGHGG
jgi:hypothetical protein